MATSRAQKTPSRRGHCNRAKRITFGSGAGPRIQKVQNVVIAARGRFGEGPEFWPPFVWSWLLEWSVSSSVLLGIGISGREARRAHVSHLQTLQYKRERYTTRIAPASVQTCTLQTDDAKPALPSIDMGKRLMP